MTRTSPGSPRSFDATCAVHGDYSFLLPDLAGALRELRDPTSPDYEPNDEDQDDDES